MVLRSKVLCNVGRRGGRGKIPLLKQTRQVACLLQQVRQGQNQLFFPHGLPVLKLLLQQDAKPTKENHSVPLTGRLAQVYEGLAAIAQSDRGGGTSTRAPETQLTLTGSQPFSVAPQKKATRFRVAFASFVCVWVCLGPKRGLMFRQSRCSVKPVDFGLHHQPDFAGIASSWALCEPMVAAGVTGRSSSGRRVFPPLIQARKRSM